MAGSTQVEPKQNGLVNDCHIVNMLDNKDTSSEPLVKDEAQDQRAQQTYVTLDNSIFVEDESSRNQNF